MATTRVELGIELVKVTVLAWLLYYAFDDADYPEVFWKPGIALLKAGLIALAYVLGRTFASIYEQGWKNYLTILYGVSIITLISWGGLGTHVEDADPLFGGGEVIVDFIPSPGERDNHAITIFFSLLIPAFYGAYKKRNPL